MKQNDGPESHDPTKEKLLRDQGREWFVEASAQTRSETMAAHQLSPEFEKRKKKNEDAINAVLSLVLAAVLFAAGYWWTTLMAIASLLSGLWSLYCLRSLWQRRNSPNSHG